MKKKHLALLAMMLFAMMTFGCGSGGGGGTSDTNAGMEDDGGTDGTDGISYSPAPICPVYASSLEAGVGDLTPDCAVKSPSGRFEFVFQSDGNLVLYDKTTPDGTTRTAKWASNTNNKGVGWCTFQSDGNLVIYMPNGEELWNTHTGNHRSAYIIVQNDGNVVIYDRDNTVLWATNTNTMAKRGPKMAAGDKLYPGETIWSPDGTLNLCYQPDGNLVLSKLPYDVWYASGTAGQTANYCIMQSDGNFVCYRPGNTFVYETMSWTDGHPGSYMLMVNDVGAVVYGPNNVALACVGGAGGGGCNLF
jgi:hypothetical protein